MTIEAVIFDMDGLLLDTERLVWEATEEAGAALGVPVSFAVFQTMIGRNYQAGRLILLDWFGNEATLQAFELKVRASVQARYEQGIPLKAGALEVVNALRASGLRTAVATSTQTERARWKLEQTGLLEMFDHVVGGDQVGRSKPEPDIFLEAARRLGVAPARTAGFEDSDNGVRAAVAAGLRTVQVPDLVPPSHELIALGHVIAPDLRAGARALGLIG